MNWPVLCVRFGTINVARRETRRAAGYSLLDGERGKCMSRSGRFLGGRGALLKGILTLVSGTIGSQVITFVSLLFLAYVYDPESFGYFSLVMSVVSILAPVAAFRYETATMLSESLEGTRAVAGMAMVSATVTVVATFTILQAASSYKIFGLGDHRGFAGWVALLVTLSAMFMILSQLALRQQQYRLIASRSLLRAAVAGVSQLALGFTPLSPYGLIAGSGLGSLSGLAVLWKQTREYLVWPGAGAIRIAAKRYWRFPVVFMPSTLLNAAGLQIPLLFLTATFGLAIGGQLGMAERIIAVPISLLGAAVGQAIDAEVGKQVRDVKGELSPLFLRFSGLLGLGAVAVTLGGLFAAEAFVPLLLGERWTMAGTFVRILTITSAVRLVASPISKYIDLLERSTANVALDVLRVVALIAGIGAVKVFELTMDQSLWVLYSALTLTYVVTWIYVFVAVRQYDRRLGEEA